MEARIREQLLQPEPGKRLGALVEQVRNLVNGDEVHEWSDAKRPIGLPVDGIELGPILGLDHLGERRPEGRLVACDRQRPVACIGQAVDRRLRDARPVSLGDDEDLGFRSQAEELGQVRI